MPTSNRNKLIFLFSVAVFSALIAIFFFLKSFRSKFTVDEVISSQPVSRTFPDLDSISMSNRVKAMFGNVRESTTSKNLNTVLNDPALSDKLLFGSVRYVSPSLLRVNAGLPSRFSRSSAIEISEINCSLDNTWLVSSKNLNLSSSKLGFMSMIEEDSLIYSYCLNNECSSIGGFCLVVK